MKVVSYLKTVPIKNNKPEKIQVLVNYIQGVKKHSDVGILHNDFSLVPDADVSVIQGWSHLKNKSTPNLNLRTDVINQCRIKKSRVCAIDSNLFLFATQNNEPHHYLRFSFDGIFPSTGTFCDSVVDPLRWESISKNLNLKIDDYKENKDNIVICMQRDGGWSMGDTDLFEWTTHTINSIRSYSDRPIILRPHPNDKKQDVYMPKLKKIFKKDKSIHFSSPKTPLEIDLKNAHAVVNHNSSSIVGPIIMGHYSFVTDPNRSQCAEVSNTDFSKIETPTEFDREKWAQRLSMFHWNFDELKSGECWAHMRNYVQ